MASTAAALSKKAVDEKLLEAVRKQNEREAQLSSLLGQGDKRGLRLLGGSVSNASFKEAVRENMDEFGATKEEAVKDVVKEFKMLGVDVQSLAEEELAEN